MKNNIFINALCCAAAGFMLGGCTVSSEPQIPTITVSIEPQRWFLERIVGEKMQVNTILSVGADPESFEPSFLNMKKLEQSVCYMKMSNFGFEKSMTERIEINHPYITIVNSAESINLIVNHDHEHCHGGHEHGIDPHVWNSAQNAEIIAGNMLEAVIKLDSLNHEYYRNNYNRLIQHIDSIDSLCKETLQSATQESFIVWHPSLSYFARDYGLHQIAIGAEGKELSISETERVIRHIISHNASVFLVENQSDISRAQVIAAEIPSLRISTISPLNYEWDKELLHTANCIAGN